MGFVTDDSRRPTTTVASLTIDDGWNRAGWVGCVTVDPRREWRGLVAGGQPARTADRRTPKHNAPRHTPGVQQEHASNPPTQTDASRMLLVRHRVRHRPPPGPPSPLLQPHVPPTCLRTPSRLRASTHRPPLTSTGPRRLLGGHRLRARRLDRTVRPISRTPHERPPRGPATGDVVRPAGPQRERPALHIDAPAGMPNMHRRRPQQPTSVRDQRIERAVAPPLAARRHRSAARRSRGSAQLDSGELAVIGTALAASAGTSRTNTCSR